MEDLLIPFGIPPQSAPDISSPRMFSQEEFDFLDISYYPDLNSLLLAGYDVESLRSNLNQLFDRKLTNSNGSLSKIDSKNASKSTRDLTKGGSSKSTRDLMKGSGSSKSTRDLAKDSGGSLKNIKNLKKLSLSFENFAVYYRRRGSSIVDEDKAGGSAEEPSTSVKKLSRGQGSFSLLPDYSEFENEEEEGGFLVLFRRKGS